MNTEIKDVSPEAPSIMSNPYAPQRRDPPALSMVPIPTKLAMRFPPRFARGDKYPFRGVVQLLPDGSVGAAPIGQPRPLLSPLMGSKMNPTSRIFANRERLDAERKILSERYLAKERVSFIQLTKPFARDAAMSLHYKPDMPGKPAPPVPYLGGAARVVLRDRLHPKNTRLPMEPIRPVGGPWTLSPASFNPLYRNAATKKIR